jgi:hypothetical protein
MAALLFVAAPGVHPAWARGSAADCGEYCQAVGAIVPHWVKVKNPSEPAVTREAVEDWGRS